MLPRSRSSTLTQLKGKIPPKKRIQQMALPTGWRDYKERQDVPTGFVVFNNLLAPTKQYNFIRIQGVLNPPPTPILQTTEIPNIILQRLHSAEIGTVILGCLTTNDQANHCT
ncbi:hypothetical protein DSO57_1009377 [Entomophthora muscae]|uniref:Uncharacterized protein n=1 Tax=Entomophthora muscae TaxID=34485 RepID=A0ACC2SJK0_9FUNG|nr:hypothetical protein DSO57_1009377 [Entomophthora muscae]